MPDAPTQTTLPRRFLQAFVAAAVSSALSMAVAAENYKFMIGANPGGGFDQTARALGRAMQEAGVAGSVTYENKGGAGGTIALAQFANASKGDSRAMIVTGAVMVGAIVHNKPPITLANATPVARLLAEYNVFVVPGDSPIRSMKEVVEQLKRDPASVKWGGGSKGSIDHISVAMIARAAGVDVAKVNYIPFKGGGEATAATLGGHVTVGTSGYGELEQFIQSGKMRALAITAPRRLQGVAAPTLIEQGIHVEIGNWRGVYGPADITPEQRKALIDAVVKATKTKSWAEAIKKYNWTPVLLTGDEFSTFVDNEHARLRAVMVQLGMFSRR